MARVRNQQAGFTLIEMMFVVAIIAVLAAVAIPAFTSESLKTKAKAEVAAFFAELSVREEQYRVETGTYLTAPVCPAAPSQGLQSMAGCVAAGQPWGPDLGAGIPNMRLKVALPMQEGRCTYEIVTGTGAGTNNPGGFTFASPPGPWYYIIATCDMDGAAGDTTYFASSVDSSIQILNEGS